ncbi:hypothetical protein [Microbacterium sp. 77mftsu3.1]|uniref:hypothetical protein n=1 Tax=Microbacterium sp. 77mftsu3.1 TaxID=1761802 RepID=UPI0003819E1F|nr:hypothetical protein [Microbacterium sp. 77mftsu3.1]SDH31518.1 hypothetical protein SAMN04488590_3004 [Microbacterium sp. 77mftsu3.1]
MTTDAERDRNRRQNGQFGAGSNTEPEVALAPAERPKSAARIRKEERLRERAGDGPYADLLFSIEGEPVTVPTRVNGKDVVGASPLSIGMMGPLDGRRTVAYADGTTQYVDEKSIERDLPPLPQPGQPVTIVDVKAMDLRPGDIIVTIADDGPSYRQVHTAGEYINMERNRREVALCFTDAPEQQVTYMNVDVEIVERPS